MANWYEYPTNYSNGTSVDGVGKFFIKYPNFILDGKFALGIVVVLWTAIFGTMLAFGSKKALTTASFITAIFAIWFAALGVLNFIVPIVLIILTIVGLIGAKEEGGL